ncbi:MULTISPECIES: DUF6261 family protein [unclassified Chryseobacterium]|uniref:DUF6261 family protein n=1 Tax=unclassified Chryseobacterium TaxID=2593645 RepID=UPI000D34441F|nr:MULTISPECIES: DUF6261 family protein [unclassified Chryseobacterium]PTT76815.1 hypothetical protein DBR25_04885 [Chryseobacterium sp. HMWF001]PVV56605.1 hypothetical protein DD829_10585 [Chryseobacterium sp. HMWF035]
MKTANDLFNTIYLYRTQEYGDASPATIKTKREETNAAYYALRDSIDALHLLVETPPSPYVTVINQLNALTDQYNTLLVNRKDTTTENFLIKFNYNRSCPIGQLFCVSILKKNINYTTKVLL